MYSSNYYRSSTSPYRAPPSKSANSYDYGRYKSGSHNNTDFGNETWPLDEVIDKIDLKSESDYHDDSHAQPPHSHHEPYSHRNIPISHHTNSKPISASSYSFGEPYRNRSNSPTKPTNFSTFGRVNSPDPDMVYSAFPDRTQSWTTSFNSGNYNKHSNSYEPYKHKESSGHKAYDSNNNYVSDDQWSLDDAFKGPMVRDVAIQCNLKKYQQSLHAAIHEPSVERVITQKPPIKVIKSSPSGLVSTFSSVPKLSNNGALSRSSPYSELDFDSYEPSPQNDVIYTQVDKKPPPPNHRVPSSSKLNSSINSNLNVVFKAPVNDSIVSHNSSSSRMLPNDSKQYDVRSKEYGFSVNNPAMPRVNINNYESRHMFNSSRDINEMAPTEKEILEETISISNASEDSYRMPKHSRNNYARDRDDLSYTGLSVASANSSNYRHASPSRYERFTSKNQPSPYGTMEKNRDTKTKIKKKKSSRKSQDPENVLLSNNSLRLKSSKQAMPSDRLYKSNADLRDSYVADETRGGLAAAYKQRQQMARTPTSDRQRALSLSRMSSAFDDHDDYRSPSLQPSRHMSHLQLGGRGSRLSDSSTGTFQRTASRSQLHERDPIVMYIPTASRESPVKQGILRNNSTKNSTSASTVTLPTKGKKASEARKSKDSERIKSSSRANMRGDAAIDKEDSKKSKNTKEKKSKKQSSTSAGTSASAVDLSRSQSMPKDTKFNWLSKLKLKSK